MASSVSDPVGRNGGNSRNGKRSKTFLTEVGPLPIDVPRDRDGSFTPAVAAVRLSAVDAQAMVQSVLDAVPPRQGEPKYGSLVKSRQGRVALMSGPQPRSVRGF